jgi:hypothetical protein
VVLEEKALPEVVGHPGGQGAGDEKAEDDVHPHGDPVHDEVLRDGRVARPGAKPPPEAAVPRDRHVHLGVALHAPETPALGVAAGVSGEAGRQEAPEDEPHDEDHHGAAEELAQGELPAEDEPHDDPELEDEVGGGDWKAMAAVKSAPLRTSERASATAA